jgi:hypothetical protein
MVTTLLIHEIHTPSIIIIETKAFIDLMNKIHAEYVMRIKDLPKVFVNGNQIFGTSTKGFFFLNDKGMMFACDDLSFSDLDKLVQAYDAYTRKNTGFKTFDEFIEPFQMGLDLKEDFDKYKNSGYATVDEFKEAKSQGYESKTDIDLAKKLGITSGAQLSEYKKLNETVLKDHTIEMDKIMKILNFNRSQLFEKLLSGKVPIKIDRDLLLLDGFPPKSTLQDVLKKMIEAWEVNIDFNKIDWLSLKPSMG